MKHITHRLLSAAAAATLGCSLCTNAVQALAGELVPPAVSYDASELVEVIVKLSGDAVLAAPEASGQGTDYIDTAAAQSAEEKLLAAQDKAEKHIRRLYPALEIKRRFTLTANGFTCTVPENIISEIESDPLVESIAAVKTDFAAAPQLANARELGGVTDYCNTTEFTGEGEVIAVIDTEFDISHDMFAPMEGKEIKIGKETVAEICSKNGFSSKLNADKVYISNKIPFAYDYSDNTPYELTAPANYHGTHVSGIAAGNRITDSDGKEISGIAPDAQLLMMKVYTDADGTQTITDESVAAAIEDAVKLRADVINMSFGRVFEYYSTLAYTDSIEAAANAGITLCASAGNYSNAQLGLSRTSTENVDTGTITEPSSFPSVFSVASADNSITTKNTLKAGSLELSYCECGSKYCGEVLADKDYPIVFIGQGQLTEITEENVSGKIVAFYGSPEEYLYLDQRCLDSGAVGIIIANDSFAYLQEGFLYTTSFPIAVITEADFRKLTDSSAETVSFVSTTIPDRYSPSISAFSSYGVGTSLDLKPEIMGVGGNVYSAAYGNSTSRMSGTSMASPYVAGCAALYDQQMKAQGAELTGTDRMQRIKNVLMNSAVPYSDDGILMSPRRQGAGLVALDKAAADKVIMTGSAGKAAIELRDGLGDTFSFELNITNISSEDVTFPYSDIALTTDGYRPDTETGGNYIWGQTVLTAENDIGTDITVPAGETVTKTVTVSLDRAQTAELRNVFTNGFFVEGYVSLYGTDNCCDISVPLIGYYGDWCTVPTITEPSRYPLSPRVSMGYTEIRTDISFAKAAQLMKNIVSTDTYLFNLDFNNPEAYPSTVEPMMSVAQKKEFGKLSDGVTYFSPNSNVFGDYLGCYYVPAREASFTGIDLYDSSGKLLYATEKDNINSYETQLALLPYEAYQLPEGRYSGRIDSYVHYGEQKKQSYPVEIALDTTAPKVTYDIVTEDGRKLLKLTATDKSLDGIYIMGTKVGRMSDESTASFNALALTQRTLSYDNYPETDKRLAAIYPQAGTGGELSDFQTILTGMVLPASGYNYCDIIPAEPDDSGTFRLTYDITNMAGFSVTVTDRAFNEVSFRSESSTPIDTFIEGMWKCINDSDEHDYYYEFHDDGTLRIIDTYNNEPYTLKYTVEGDKITLDSEGNITEGTIRWFGPYTAQIIYSGGKWTEMLSFDTRAFADKEVTFFSDEELMDLARSYYANEHGVKPEFARAVFNMEDYSISVSVYDYNDGKEEVRDVYTVSRETGIGVDIDGDRVDLKTCSRLDKIGVWSAYTPTFDLNMARYFNIISVAGDTVSGVYAYQSDGIEHEFICTFVRDTAVFSFDSYQDAGKPSRTARMTSQAPGKLELTWDNGFYEELTYHPFTYEISELGFLTNGRLIELTRGHFAKTTFTEPDRLDVVYTGIEDLAEVRIYMKDAEGFEDWIEVYTVDIYTGKGHNSDGMAVDLLNDFKETYTLGDVNEDGKIDAKDSSEILVYYAKVSTGGEGDLSDTQKTAANVNGDGKIDAKDASAILGYYSYTSTGGTAGLGEYLHSSKAA
ncbi:MAG: S8 family serine peptidase [Ruminococcus sp.]|nr:S8 family serine peptidase [Ruminococcus sp.]